jgi:hypothetical protein
MTTVRKPVDLGGTVARNSERAAAAIADIRPSPDKPAETDWDERPRRKRRTEATRTTTVRVPESVLKRFNIWCIEHDTTAQEVLEDYITRLVAKDER